ncbi:MAG: serine hydrolase domain-containing protein [Pseudomonadota bacterium]
MAAVPARRGTLIVRRKTLIGLLAVSFLLAACGGDRTSESRAEREAAFDKAVEAAMEKVKVPGLVVAKLEGCTTSRVITYGVANSETREPVETNTAMEAASLSKPVAAYLLMEMVDQGMVDLDEKVADTLDWPRISDQSAYRRLTPRMLLSHQTGMPNWAGDSGDPDRDTPLRFAFKPGEKYRYSGEGYGLLQAFLEAKSGSSLEELFRERLGAVMPMSTFASGLPEGAIAAYGHGGGGGQRKGRPLGEPGAPHAAYSLRTVVEDYARFAERLCSGDGLSAFTYRAFTEPQVNISRKKRGQISWALGIGRQQHRGQTTLFHWGDNEQFKAFVAVVPETGQGVVFFANGKNGLKLIDAVAGPSVGNTDPLIAWLGYGQA